MPIRDSSLRERYRESVNGCCEVHQYRECCNGGIAHVHHITAGPHRNDVWSNLLCVCEWSHLWIHAEQPIDGRVLCWWVKHRKGEFDVPEIRLTWKQCPIAWIERKINEVEDLNIRRFGLLLLGEFPLTRLDS